MKLYFVEVANYLDNTIKIIPVLSNEPLNKNSNSLTSCRFDDNEYIHRCYIPEYFINAWNESEYDEAQKIINLLNQNN